MNAKNTEKVFPLKVPEDSMWFRNDDDEMAAFCCVGRVSFFVLVFFFFLLFCFSSVYLSCSPYIVLVVGTYQGHDRPRREEIPHQSPQL